MSGAVGAICTAAFACAPLPPSTSPWVQSRAVCTAQPFGTSPSFFPLSKSKCKARRHQPLQLKAQDEVPVDMPGPNPIPVKRIPLLPIPIEAGGVLFPECKSNILVIGDTVDTVRSIEAEQLPLVGYCNIGTDGKVMPIGTIALLEEVKWGIADEPSESSEDSVDDDSSNALCKCVGVQRFNIVEIERTEPYPIAKVQLFNDLDDVSGMPDLESKTLKAIEEVLSLSAKLIKEGKVEEAAAVREAFERIQRFAPGGPGTFQEVMGPLGPIGWKLGERERLELSSFALADITETTELDRYHILEATSTMQRFQRVMDSTAPTKAELAAKVSLKSIDGE
mmetsp:Transcript_4009/g.9657  ORF Transcript_4009/g.9657 Transcript_4009/m.9657 type:complete len:337 (-) Transcript_4009:326-1336(-)